MGTGGWVLGTRESRSAGPRETKGEPKGAATENERNLKGKYEDPVCEIMVTVIIEIIPQLLFQLQSHNFPLPSEFHFFLLHSHIYIEIYFFSLFLLKKNFNRHLHAATEYQSHV